MRIEIANKRVITIAITSPIYLIGFIIWQILIILFKLESVLFVIKVIDQDQYHRE